MNMMSLFRKKVSHYFAKVGDLAKMKKLLDKNPELVNKRNKKGETALHIAAENGYEHIAELLLTKGADIEAQTEYYWSPLYCAVSASKEAMSKFLIMKGADVKSSCYNSGRTILAVAIERRLVEISKILLSKGADVKSRDKLGATPLHTAAWHGQLKIAKLLLSMGADVNAKDSQVKKDNRESLRMWHAINPYDGVDPEEDGLVVGFTPLDYAVDQGHKEVVNYLEGYTKIKNA